MLYTLRYLQNDANETQAEINGKWVPARPLNYKYESWSERVSDAWLVLTGKADVFVWPENQ